MSSIPILFAAFLLSAPAPVPCKTYIATPKLLEAQIRSRGASTVLRELYNSWADASFTEGPEKQPFDCWGPVLKHIGGGSKAWLEIGWQLRQESDAGASSMLEEAIGNALDTNPANVLRLVSAKPTGVSLLNLCGSQISIWAGSEKIAQVAVATRRRSVSGMSDPTLIGPKRECLGVLEEFEKQLPSIYRESSE